MQPWDYINDDASVILAAANRAVEDDPKHTEASLTDLLRSWFPDADQDDIGYAVERAL